MDTQDLITILAQSPEHKKPVSFGVALVLLFSATFVLTVFILGLRTDLILFPLNMTAIHKTILLSSVAVSVGFFLSEISKPIPLISRVMPYVWLSIVLFMCSIGYEVVTTPFNQIIGYFLIINFPECLFFVFLYGALGSLAFLWLMKFYAPHDVKLAGMGIGLAASAVGALGYSLHCPLDSPVFITVAYGVPIMVMGMIGKFIISRYIKW